MAEINGLLNRRTSLKMYRGFESLPHRKGPDTIRAFIIMVCVYFLYSESLQQYYCGQTSNVGYRLDQHNASEVKSTKHGVPWKLIGFVIMETRSAAMILERQVKSRGIGRWLEKNEGKVIKQPLK